MDRVYRAMLASLPLDARHRQDLRRRGLKDTEILRRGYRSLLQAGRSRIAGEMVERFGPDLVSRVPGFVQCEGNYGPYWTLASQPGTIIPVRNMGCAIVGLTVRVVDPGEGGKYRWLSSRHAGGPGPGSQCHVPMFSGDKRVVRLTEGPLKADVATCLGGVLSIGLPGCTQWKLALSALERFQPEVVLLSWDCDWRSNPNVARSLGDAAWELNELGYHVEFEFWQSKCGKGIDDVLANGHQPERRHWTQALAACARGLARPINNEVKRHA